MITKNKNKKKKRNRVLKSQITNQMAENFKRQRVWRASPSHKFISQRKIYSMKKKTHKPKDKINRFHLIIQRK